VAMQHVNAQPPDLLEQRPDLPLRLVAAVDRALEKDPARRFQSMHEFAAELRRVLAELNEPDSARTMIVPRAVLKESRPHRARAQSRRWPIYALVLTLAAAAIAAGILALGGAKGKGHRSSSSSGAAPVRLRGVGDYDPQGSDTHADTAGNATDGNPSTYWETQIYATPNFGNLKAGLGLELDAGSAAKLGTLTVSTPTPGFTAEVLATSSLDKRPVVDSAPRTVTATTTFHLRGATARYYIVWITRLPPGNTAHISEVTARR
jgi:eukaryotic-like serine/threonine-protein kinase